MNESHVMERYKLSVSNGFMLKNILSAMTSNVNEVNGRMATLQQSESNLNERLVL